WICSSPLAMSLLHREVEQHGGASAFAARDRDRASVLVHDRLADRKPQAGAARLGREEWIEQLGQHAARDTGPLVYPALLLDLTPRSAAASGISAAIAGAAPRPAGGAAATHPSHLVAKLAAFRHRLHGVERHVEQHLRDEIAVNVDGAEPRRH